MFNYKSKANSARRENLSHACVYNHLWKTAVMQTARRGEGRLILRVRKGVGVDMCAPLCPNQETDYTSYL